TVTRAKLIAKPEVQELIETTSQRLRSELAGLPFEQLEEAVLVVAGEATRVALEAELQELADQFGDTVLVDGREYQRHEPGSVLVHSLCGGLSVTRFTYREVGVRNGPTIVPVALQAGLSRERRRPLPTTWRTATPSMICASMARCSRTRIACHPHAPRWNV